MYACLCLFYSLAPTPPLLPCQGPVKGHSHPKITQFVSFFLKFSFYQFIHSNGNCSFIVFVFTLVLAHYQIIVWCKNAGNKMSQKFKNKKMYIAEERKREILFLLHLFRVNIYGFILFKTSSTKTRTIIKKVFSSF